MASAHDEIAWDPQFYAPTNYSNYRYQRTQGLRPGWKPPRSFNIPRAAIPIKRAEWYLNPQTGVLGLGRYSKRKRRATVSKLITAIRALRPKRTVARRGKRTKRARRSKMPKYDAHGERIDYPKEWMTRAGRGGFFDFVKDIGKKIYGGVKAIAPSVVKALAPVAKTMLSPHGLGEFVDPAISLMGLGKYKRRYAGHGQFIAQTGTPNPGMDAIQGDYSLGSEPLIWQNSAVSEPGSLPIQTIAANNLMRTATVKQTMPSIVNAEEGMVTISHREYVTDLQSHGGQFFVAHTFTNQPGLGSQNGGAFSWLSQIAQHFQQYRWNGLVYEFVSTSGSLSTSQALGEVVVCTNYDVGAPPPATKRDMLTQAFAISRVPAADFEHPVETDPRQTVLNGKLYTRGALLERSADRRFYDHSETVFATQGQAAPVTLGEIWVTYQVSFLKPQLPSVSGSTANGSSYFHYHSLIPQNVSLTDVFGFNAVQQSTTNFVLAGDLPFRVGGTNGNNTITITSDVDPGYYHVRIAACAQAIAQPIGTHVGYYPLNLNVTFSSTDVQLVGAAQSQGPMAMVTDAANYNNTPDKFPPALLIGYGDSEPRTSQVEFIIYVKNLNVDQIMTIVPVGDFASTWISTAPVKQFLQTDVRITPVSLDEITNMKYPIPAPLPGA